MEMEARQRANADKLRRQAENELEDLRETVGMPPTSSTFLSSAPDHFSDHFRLWLCPYD